MLTDEILKALIEGIIYVAPEPVTLEGILKALEGEERERVKAKLDELTADYEQNFHGIQIRQVANGYKFSTKAEHHETLRKYVKSLKAPIRLSKPALETLAVIAYRQPVTVPEIEEIRGVDSGGVIHTLLEKKLVVTSGRKSVVGRPVLYRTSKDFLVHFGLKDVGELPSLKEFEELAKRALGSDLGGELPAAEGATAPSEGSAAPAGNNATGEPATAPSESAGAPEEVPAASPEPGGDSEAAAIAAPEVTPPPVETAPESVAEAARPEEPGENAPAEIAAEQETVEAIDASPTAAEPADSAAQPASVDEEGGAPNAQAPPVAVQESSGVAELTVPAAGGEEHENTQGANAADEPAASHSTANSHDQEPQA